MPGLRDYGIDSPEIFKGDLGKSGWSNEDIARQAAVLGLLGADFAQTRSIAKGIPGIHETNPILGEHPSKGRVDNYFAAAMIGHTLLMHALPPELRKWAQYGTIGLEAPTVGRNKFVFNIGMTF